MSRFLEDHNYDLLCQSSCKKHRDLQQRRYSKYLGISAIPLRHFDRESLHDYDIHVDVFTMVRISAGYAGPWLPTNRGSSSGVLGVLAWKSEGILNWLMLKPELETGLHYLYNAEYLHMHYWGY